jgi:STE24 endopeptidase
MKTSRAVTNTDSSDLLLASGSSPPIWRLLLVLVALVLVPAPSYAASQGQPMYGAVGDTSGDHTPDAVTRARGPVAVPEASEKILRYYRSGNVLWLINMAWALLIPTLFLFSGFSARIRDVAQGIGRRWFFVIAAYVIIYFAVNYLLKLPLNYYQGFLREHEYGLSNQSFWKWFGDSLKSLMVTVVGGMLLVWIPYLLIKKSPRRWWLYTGIAAVPVMMLFMLVYPIWIAPLFNEFGPMHDKALEAKILQLANHASIDGGRVFEVNKSKDTEAVNAYVSGLLNTKRIVLWDTLVQKLDRDQVLAVMGHEMGHYVRGDIWKLIVLFSGLILVALYAIYRLMPLLIQQFHSRFGFDEPADIASLPLILLLLSSSSLVLAPVAMAYTRHIEHEADRFGLELTRDNHAMTSALLLLQQENLMNPDPGPLYRFWRAWHPVLADRIRFANTYRPWEMGKALKYGGLFHQVK